MNQTSQIAHEVAQLQQLLLPKDLPDVSGYSFAVHYQPCEAAGGDFYGWQIWDDGSLGIGIADVAGHGVRAAVVMAMLRACIASSKHFRRPPEMFMDDLNGFFSEIPDLNSFVTCVFVRLDQTTGNFSFRNCGHPSPKIRRKDGTVETIRGGRLLPLGILIPETVITPPALGQLNPGDALVLYTDGVPESTGMDGSFFDDERLDAAISTAGAGGQCMIESITQALNSHRGNRLQRDDQCMVVIVRDK